MKSPAVLLAALLLLSPGLRADEVSVEPAPPAFGEAWGEALSARLGGTDLGSTAHLHRLVVVQGGAREAEVLGPRKVTWAEGRFELAMARPPRSPRAYVLALDSREGRLLEVAPVPTPPGGEPRLYLSDRDALVAFTVDHGTWDTCPEIRWLHPDGPRTVPLPCPQAGIAALRALRASRGGTRPEARTASPGQLQLRLVNLRWVRPSFFLAGGVELDATLRWRHGGRTEFLPARFRLAEGTLTDFRLLPEEEGAR